MTMIPQYYYEDLPTEIHSLVESFLQPSDCANLSATSTSFHRRWTARRWYRTFQLHYGWRDQARSKEWVDNVRKSRLALVKLIRLNMELRQQHRTTLYWDDSERKMLLSGDKLMLPSIANINAAFSKYNECYRNGWEFTFVGCCHDKELDVRRTGHLPSRPCCDAVCTNSDDETRSESHHGNYVVGKGGAVEPPSHPPQPRLLNNCGCLVEEPCAITTKFDITALVPSMKRLCVDLWDTIELSLLGYYDAADDEEETIGTQIIHDRYPVPAIMHILRTSVLPDLFEYLYFMVGFKPLAMKRTAINISTSRRRRRGGGVLGPMLSRRFFGGHHTGSKRPQQQLRQFHVDTVASLSSAFSYLISRPSFGHAWRGIASSQEFAMNSSFAQVQGSITTFDDIKSLSDAACNMPAWKLACFLRQRGVGCLRCEICNCIDLTGDDLEGYSYNGSAESGKLVGQIDSGSVDERDDGPRCNSFRIHPEANERSTLLQDFRMKIGGGGAWITPCQCRDPVHRQCLERKLNLTTKYEPWERLKLCFGRLCTFLTRAKEDQTNETYSIAPNVWISYDNTIPVGLGWRHQTDNSNIEEVVAVDDTGRFRSPHASCDRCGGRFVRTVRLPRSRWEVLAASLSDPISLMRAVSTLIHFVLACAFLAACEGMCSDASCSSHRILLTTPLGELKWPTTGLNGLALAWWQLQQCCMLHIFFSRRFGAIVDRLWMGPISLLYFRLYFYFIATSALLTASYIPMVSRTIRINCLESWVAPWVLELLQPVGDAVALANLMQYAFVSTTVICIFWRTNYRMYTVADGKEAAANMRRRADIAPDLPGVDNPERIERQRHVANNVDLELHPWHRIWGDDDMVNAANHPIYHGPW